MFCKINFLLAKKHLTRSRSETLSSFMCFCFLCFRLSAEKRIVYFRKEHVFGNFVISTSTEIIIFSTVRDLAPQLLFCIFSLFLGPLYSVPRKGGLPCISVPRVTSPPGAWDSYAASLIFFLQSSERSIQTYRRSQCGVGLRKISAVLDGSFWCFSMPFIDPSRLLVNTLENKSIYPQLQTNPLQCSS